MRKLIFLSGISNCGKTTMLKILICKLLTQKGKYPVSVIYYKNSVRLKNLIDSYLNNMPLVDGDFSIVLDIGGVIVGICTEGDSLGAVWYSIDFFERRNCEIGILACHPEHLDRSLPCMVKPWQSYEIIKKYEATDVGAQDAENAKMAQDLYDILMK